MACMAAMHERRRVCGRVPPAYGVMPRERPGVAPGEAILSAPRPVALVSLHMDNRESRLCDICGTRDVVTDLQEFGPWMTV